ncbi:MAG: hypothetical protein WC314_23920 [Vulcanimicrobiota bacterium]
MVETIFSTLFISLTVLAIVNLFPGAYMSVKKSELRFQSDYIAQSIIEDLRRANLSLLITETSDEARYYAVVTPDNPTRFEPLSTRNANWDQEFEQYGLSVDDIRYLALVTVRNLPDYDPKIVKGVSVEIEYSVGALKQSSLHETYLHSLN